MRPEAEKYPLLEEAIKHSSGNSGLDHYVFA
jgi:hypothetical protein